MAGGGYPLTPGLETSYKPVIHKIEASPLELLSLQLLNRMSQPLDGSVLIVGEVLETIIECVFVEDSTTV